MGHGAHIGQSLRNLRLVRSHKPASICQGRESTGAELVDRVARLARGLLELGLQDGDRVAISALSSEKYLEWLLGVPCAGGIIAPLNYRWSTEEASEAVNLVGARFFVCDETTYAWCQAFKEHCPSTEFFILISPPSGGNANLIDYEALIQPASPSPELLLRRAPNGIALICFTSGTTGRPKGAAISHDAIVFQSLSKIAVVGYAAKDVFVHVAALCHIGGISSALAMIMAGGCQIFLPKFQIDDMLAAIHEFNATAMITMPVMIMDMASSSYLAARKGRSKLFPSVTTILNGAGAIPPSLLKFVTDLFPNAQISSAFGMTEACSSMSFINVHKLGVLPEVDTDVGSRHLGGVCVGRPAPHVEMAIRSEAGQIGGLYIPGNVLTRGPHVMSFYWGQPEQTRNVLSEDGWLDTGDFGWCDGIGQLWLLGRQKDVIKTGGENVYASEVEGILRSHPGVVAAAVVGIPDHRLHEAVAAVVRLKTGWDWVDGAHMTEDKQLVSPSLLRDHCGKLGLSRYKIPKVLVMQEGDFPETTTGKLKKDLIRDALLNKLSQLSGPRLSKL